MNASRKEAAGPGRSRFSSLAEAKAELERRYGPSAASWPYYDSTGATIGESFYWDTPDGLKGCHVAVDPTPWAIRGIVHPFVREKMCKESRT